MFGRYLAYGLCLTLAFPALLGWAAPMPAAAQITTPQIRDGAITTEKIADGAVTSQKIAAGVVPNLVWGSVTGTLANQTDLWAVLSNTPTKTGTGASGTWPIGITGNAATATALVNGVGTDFTWNADHYAWQAPGLYVPGGVEADTLIGDGSQITGIDPANIQEGTAPISITGSAATAAGLSASTQTMGWNAANSRWDLTGGLNVTGPVIGDSFTGSASGLTNVPADQFGASKIPPANLGTGTPSASTYLNGAGAWTAKDWLTASSSLDATKLTGTASVNTTGTASNITGTVAVANGGTGATTASGARTNLGAAGLGANTFTGDQSVTGRLLLAGPSPSMVAIAGGNSATNNTQSVVIGISAGTNLASTYANTLVGWAAGNAGASVFEQTGIGYASLYNATGAGNTAVGANSGRIVTSGTNNTFLGSSAGYTGTAPTVTNATAIGYNAQVTQSNRMVLGQGLTNGILAGGVMDAPGYKVSGSGGTAGQVLMSDGTAFKAGNILPSVAISMPATLYAVEGHETSVYWWGVVRSDVPMDTLDFDVDCAKGKQQDERWTYTPTGADVGTTTLTLTVRSRGITLATQTVNLKTSAASAGTGVTRKVIFIGDSTTNDKPWLSELVNMFGYNHTSPTVGGGADVMSLVETGTLTASVPDAGGTNRTVYHEGRSGWTINQYYTDATSPFVFSGVFDFGQYLTANSITLATGDWVIVSLGINDVFGYGWEPDLIAKMGAMKTQMDAMIASIQSAVPGVRVGVSLLIPPTSQQSGFGAAYGSGQTLTQYKRNRDLWREAVLANYGGRTGSNIYVVPLGANLDPVHGFPSTMTAANSRTAATVLRDDNGVHPTDSGYYQMADSYFAFFKGNES